MKVAIVQKRQYWEPQKSLLLRCKQTNKVKNELNGQPSSFLNRMHVSIYKETFSSMRLLF